MRTSVTAAALVLVLAGCGGTERYPFLGTGSRDGTCVEMFRHFDWLVRSNPNEATRRGRRVIDPELQGQANRLRQGGCISWTKDLGGLDSTAPGSVTDSGPTIPSLSVHAGVVTSLRDAGRAVAFFEARGVRARTQGQVTLGTRIYLGPFATQGALDGAIELSREGGFVAPYPANFF